MKFNKKILFFLLLILSCSTNPTSLNKDTNTKPEASFIILPETGSISTVFTFDASKSSDNEDSASLLEVRWDWENDGVWDTEYSEVKTISHQFINKGSKLIALEVRNTESKTDTVIKQLSVTQVDSLNAKYLRVGNKYTFYKYSYHYDPIAGMEEPSIKEEYFTETILSDSVINGRKYYIVVNSQTPTMRSLQRSDLNSIYYFLENKDSLAFSFNVSVGELISTIHHWGKFNITTKELRQVLGESELAIDCQLDYPQINLTYSKKFGFIYWYYHELEMPVETIEKIELVGAVIDGIVYGDTVITRGAE